MAGSEGRALGRDLLESHLASRRDAGRKLLVVYVTAGAVPDWTEAVRAAAAAGADAVEIGIPFSDPMIDGPTIQAASAQALARGTTPGRVLEAVAELDAGVPVVVMTYANVLAHPGYERSAAALAAAGACGAIVPDLPLDELDGWADAAAAAGLATVLLAAPTTPEPRLRRIAERTQGFLYAVGLLGVTGERERLAASAVEVARRCAGLAAAPVLVGIGVSTPTQAAEVARVADGVVVGSAIVRRLLEGESVDAVGSFVEDLRRALDS